MFDNAFVDINNVGSISQALFAKGNTEFDEFESAKWQSMQVSILSIANCLGRIFIGIFIDVLHLYFLSLVSLGLAADTMKNVFRLPRSYCICFIALIFIQSQILLLHIEDVEALWYASASLGLAYGGVFGLFPTVTIEWFGLSTPLSSGNGIQKY